MKSLLSFFSLISNFFKNRRKNKLFNTINEKLESKLKDREVERIILKGQIINMCKKFVGVNSKSRYIPKKYKNNTKIKKRVLAEFGERMEKLGVKLTDDLELVS